jgi:hypothetical protein
MINPTEGSTVHHEISPREAAAIRKAQANTRKPCGYCGRHTEPLHYCEEQRDLDAQERRAGTR